jgi:hypothetical protein
MCAAAVFVALSMRYGLNIFNHLGRKFFDARLLKGRGHFPKFAPTAPDYGAENGRTVQSKLESMV